MGNQYLHITDAVSNSSKSPSQVLSKAERRQWKPDRDVFNRLPRRPITVVLDRIRNKPR